MIKRNIAWLLHITNLFQWPKKGPGDGAISWLQAANISFLTQKHHNPLALHYISHIGGGEQPSKFGVLGKTSWEAWRRWHGRGAMGQKQHL